MRREQFSLAVSDVAWVETDAEPRRPTITLAFDGDPAALRERLLDADEERADAANADLAVRLQRSADTGEAQAIVALSHRLTGDYILELNADPETVLAFTRAARRYGELFEEGPKYRARIVAGGEELAAYDKETLLVYGPDGELLRQHSLIPGGVEL
ncbi:MAG: DUF5793 family protein [Halobacteriales archaeon]